MSNCVLCSAPLKFANTPNFGSGKILSGGSVCLDCFITFIEYNSTIKLKNYTVEQLKELNLKIQESNERVFSQINSLNLSKEVLKLGKKEISELPKIIHENETMIALIHGYYNSGSGILVLTDQRLIFVDKGLVYGLKTEDFGLNKISSISVNNGFLMSDIKIMATGNESTIKNVDKGAAKDFCEKVRAKLSEPKEAPQNVTVIQNQLDIADQLEKLAGLKDKGILTQEEFDIQKKKLLGL